MYNEVLRKKDTKSSHLKSYVQATFYILYCEAIQMHISV